MQANFKTTQHHTFTDQKRNQKPEFSTRTKTIKPKWIKPKNQIPIHYKH